MPVVVAVSNPETVFVGEHHGLVELCSILSTEKDIRWDVTVSVETRNGTGIIIILGMLCQHALFVSSLRKLAYNIIISTQPEIQIDILDYAC